MAGLFITFEGTEGCGKSTQISALAARLQSEGRQVLQTREPGGTPLGEAVRNLLQHDQAGEGMSPEAELLLFTASRAQLTRERILPAIAQGVAVQNHSHNKKPPRAIRTKRLPLFLSPAVVRTNETLPPQSAEAC